MCDVEEQLRSQYQCVRCVCDTCRYWCVLVESSCVWCLMCMRAVPCLFARGGMQIEGVYNDATKQESRIGKRVEIERGPQVSMFYLNPKP